MLVFKALIVDSNVSSRTRLKEAAYNGVLYKAVRSAGNIKQALKTLSKPEYYDIVFVSSRFGEDAVNQFIEVAKETKGGSDTAYIILYSSGYDNTELAARLVSGADAFLVEPYSVEAVVEIAKIAEKVKLKNAEARLAAASDVIVSTMSSEIDSRADLKALGKNTKHYSKNLKSATKQIKTLAGDAAQAFLEAAFEHFENASPRPPAGGVDYEGASERVKRLHEQKLAKEAKEKAEEGEGEGEAEPTNSQAA